MITGMTVSQSQSEAEPLLGGRHVPTYPPFSAWKQAHNPAVTSVLNEARPAGPLGIYLHIPFCQKKCDYCYLLSFVGQAAQVINEYVETLVDEMEIYASQNAIAGRPVEFVYFGGGTPSMLSSEQIRELVAGLKRALPWDGVREITFECAPKSVRATFVEALLDLGITRLSLGVQSLDDELLHLNGRIHLRADVLRAYQTMREAGSEYVNLDLMCGLPGETDESWKRTMDEIIQLQPESISIYQTELPCNTEVHRRVQAGMAVATLVPWDSKRARLETAFDALAQAGYTIVSGYTAVKNPERHTFVYQEHLSRGLDLVGLGTGAFGYVQGVHYENETALDTYGTSVRSGILPLRRSYPLSPRDRMIREFVLQLKFGFVEASAWRDKFGVDIVEELKRPLGELKEKGFLTVEQQNVRLTDRGLLSVDWLTPTFFDVPFRQGS